MLFTRHLANPSKDRCLAAPSRNKSAKVIQICQDQEGALFQLVKGIE